MPAPTPFRRLSSAALLASAGALAAAIPAVAQQTTPAPTASPSPTATAPAPGPTPKAAAPSSAPAPATTAPAARAPAGPPDTGAPASSSTTPSSTAPAAAAPASTAPASAAPAAPTGPNPTVGGAAMDAMKPIAVNASAAPNLSTLVTAVKAAGLAETLSGPGPFTVFAPTNDAFGRLPAATVTSLLDPGNKPTLVKVLTYHVVPGTLTLAEIRAKTVGDTVLTLTTVEGEPLTLRTANGAIELSDVNGNKSYIETPDVRQSNGIVHVVNGVLVPKL